MIGRCVLAQWSGQSCSDMLLVHYPCAPHGSWLLREGRLWRKRGSKSGSKIGSTTPANPSGLNYSRIHSRPLEFCLSWPGVRTPGMRLVKNSFDWLHHSKSIDYEGESPKSLTMVGPKTLLILIYFWNRRGETSLLLQMKRSLLDARIRFLLWGSLHSPNWKLTFCFTAPLIRPLQPDWMYSPLVVF